MLLRRDNRDTIARDIREVNRMGEIAEGFIRAGREEGMEEGMEKGREEGRARLVSVQTEAVINFMGLGKSLEEAVALAHVPDDCIDEVREAVLARQNL